MLGATMTTIEALNATGVVRAVQDAVSVYASDLQIAVRTTTEYYVWGTGLIYDGYSLNKDHDIFDENPIKINLK